MIEDDIRYLEDAVIEIHSLIHNLILAIKIIKPDHDIDCFVSHNKNKLLSKSFTKSQGWDELCQCKNKIKHNKKMLI